MNVNINETWNDETMMQFNDGSALSGKTGGNGNNTPFGNGNFQRLEAPAAKDGPAGQQQTHRRSPLYFLNELSYRKKAALSTGPGRKSPAPENRSGGGSSHS
jgi:hypothetical protein